MMDGGLNLVGLCFGLQCNTLVEVPLDETVRRSPSQKEDDGRGPTSAKEGRLAYAFGYGRVGDRCFFRGTTRVGFQ